MLDTWERRSTEGVIDRVEREGGDARTKASGRRAHLLPQLLPIDLAVRDWARRDRAVAKRLRRVDNRHMDYRRSQSASVTSDPDDVEARCLLAFSAVIGHYFIAAEHAGPSRAEVLDLAARRLFTQVRRRPLGIPNETRQAVSERQFSEATRAAAPVAKQPSRSTATRPLGWDEEQLRSLRELLIDASRSGCRR